MVKSTPPTRAPFWAWPNNVSRLCVAQARGLLSVYKSRGTPLYPFTCARTVGAAPTATLSRAGEGSRREAEAQDGQGNAKTKDTKEREGEVGSPGKALAGQPPRPRQEPCRGTFPMLTERATIEHNQH